MKKYTIKEVDKQIKFAKKEIHQWINFLVMYEGLLAQLKAKKK